MNFFLLVPRGICLNGDLEGSPILRHPTPNLRHLSSNFNGKSRQYRNRAPWEGRKGGPAIMSDRHAPWPQVRGSWKPNASASRSTYWYDTLRLANMCEGVPCWDLPTHTIIQTSRHTSFRGVAVWRAAGCAQSRHCLDLAFNFDYEYLKSHVIFLISQKNGYAINCDALQVFPINNCLSLS